MTVVDVVRGVAVSQSIVRPGESLKARAVQLSARGSDISFVIDSEAPFDQVAEELRSNLAANVGLFSKGNVSVDAGRRLMSPGELGRIRQIIESRSGLTVTRFWCSPDALDGASHNQEPVHCEPVSLETPAPPLVQADMTAVDALPLEPFFGPGAAGYNPPSAAMAAEKPAEGPSRNRTEALLIKATFRSGEIVHHPGDVVVMADVNPGSEIHADGDIVVLGALKGLVHAGASGDTKAVIIAMELASPRVQIGPYDSIAPPPRNSRSKSPASHPKIAYVRRRSIYVAPFVGRFARYTKGVPYEG